MKEVAFQNFGCLGVDFKLKILKTSAQQAVSSFPVGGISSSLWLEMVFPMEHGCLWGFSTLKDPQSPKDMCYNLHFIHEQIRAEAD